MQGKNITLIIGTVFFLSLSLGLFCSTFIPTLIEETFQTTEQLIEKYAIQEEMIKSFFERGEALRNAGDYQNAAATYLEIIALEPENNEAAVQLAYTYSQMNSYEESEKWFLKALDTQPKNFHLYTDLGLLYRNEKRYEDAEAMFKKALELNVEWAETYSDGFGYLYLEEGRYEEAEEMFAKALELNPDASNYIGIADYYRKMKKYDLSEKMYKKSSLVDPKGGGYYGLGLLYEDQERYEDAEKMFLLYLTDIQKTAEVYNALTRVYTIRHMYDKATATVESGLELKPGDQTLLQAQRRIIQEVSELKS